MEMHEEEGNMNNRENFAKRLRELMEGPPPDHVIARLAEIWARCKAAPDASNKARDRLSVWESGKNFPDPEILEKLASALGMKASDLAAPRAGPPDDH